MLRLYSTAIYGGLSAITVEIHDLVVSGNLQVDLSLMPAPPLVAGMRVMFTENPYLSYDVVGMWVVNVKNQIPLESKWLNFTTHKDGYSLDFCLYSSSSRRPKL